MRKLFFQGGSGAVLAALFDEPTKAIKAYALFAHCFTCTKDILAASRIANMLRTQGIAVIRFDFTGLGASEGDFSNTNFSSNVEDVIAAANFMRDEMSPPSILIGHSLGGSAVLSAAPKIPETKAVVTIGAPADVAHVVHHFQSAREQIIRNGAADVSLIGRSFKIKKQFIDDVESVKLEAYVRNLKKALLILHAPTDQTVDIENAAKIFDWAKHPKSYISLGDTDHLISKKQDAEYIAHMIAAWAQKYI